MKILYKLRLLIGCLLLAMLFSSCQRPENNQASEPIQIGGLFSLTGAKSDMGIPSSKGAQLAINLLNENGGILGQNVELLIRDGKSDAQQGKEMVGEILSEAPNTVAFMGFCDSDLAEAAAKEAQQNNRIFLTSGATSPLLPAQVPGNLFLACFGDNVQAAAAAEWAFDALKARTATVIYDSTTTYTKLLQGYFIDRFTSLGGEIVGERSYNPTDMASIGQGLPNADFVFLSAGSANDAQRIIELLRSSGYDVPVVGGDGLDSETVWEANPEMTDIYYTTHAFLGVENPDEQVAYFRAAYHKAFGGNEPDAFAALNFDAINLLAQAIQDAGSTEPRAVQEALSQIADFSGVTGEISFKNGQQIPHKSVTIMEAKDGQRVFIKQFIPQKDPIP
ncbi:MAG: ABC transporter substrate-binding protein [Cyclobacteriaceae bacterium]